MNAPIPNHDAERLEVLRQYSILDTPAEEEYDALARLAAFAAETPVALISLVDRERVWFKARVGTDTVEAPRAWAFSAYAINQIEPFLVEDATADPRFAAHPRVAGPPGLRFYAGFPLITREGHVLGTLNVLDNKPRRLSPQQLAALQTIASQAMHLLDLRRARLEMNEAIADLQLAHAERVVTEQKFSTVFQLGPDALLLTRQADGRILHVNRRFTEMTGYSTEEAVGRTTLDLNLWVHPQERQDYMAELIKTGRVRTRDTQFRTKAGEQRTGEGSAETIEVAGEKCLLVVMRDITERKHAEAERERLLESERGQRLEAETLRDVALALASRRTLHDVLDEILTQARRLVPCDAANLRLVEGDIIHVARAQGYEEHGAGIDDLKMNAVDFPLNQAVLRERIPLIVDDTRLEKDWVPLESTRWIRSHMTLPICVQDHVVGMLKLASAQPGYFTAAHADVLVPLASAAAVAIEQALLTDMLRESEAKFRALTETVASAIFISRSERILYVNREAERLLGYTREELLAMPSTRIIHPDDVETVRRRREARLRGEEVRSRYEFRLVDRQGRARWVDFTATVAEYEGAPAVLGTAFDITERKMLEEQLRQAQKMEAVGRLAGGVAHDFNNLLNVILGYSELLLDDMPKEDPRRAQLEQIARAGDRAASLTSQLLAFSRQQVLQPRVVNLNEVIGTVEKMLQRVIGEDVGVHTRLDNELGRVRIDPGQIEQMVMNLAVNARDAMPAGGSLTLETANVTLTETDCRTLTDMAPGHYVRLQVIDSGAGMDAETLARCFEPFFTTKEVGKGTGLGLSMVYGIVKQSGGHITASSTPGQGSTFRVFFPRVDEPAAEPAAAAHPVAPVGTETILVVEDEPAVRRLACDYLAEKGYTVLEAPNPARAVEMVREHTGKIDMVLTDVIMPGLSGRELVETLRGLRPGLRVLYMSGYTADAIAHHGVLDPGVEFIQKPFTPSALARRLRETLDAK